MRADVVGEAVDDVAWSGHRGQGVGAELHRPAVPGDRDDLVERQRADHELDRVAGRRLAPICFRRGCATPAVRAGEWSVDGHRFI